MSTVTEQTRPSTAEQLIGTWRRFGETGPVYEVIATAAPVANKPTLRIRVLESGEELDYPLSHLLDDPRAS